MDYRKLRKNIKKDYSGFPKVRVALLSDQSPQYPAQSIRAMAYEYRIDAEIYEAPFDSMEAEALDPASGLYAFAPDITVLLPAAEKIRARYYETPPDEREGFAGREASRLLSIADRVTSASGTNVAMCNILETDDGIYGSYAASYSLSLLSVLRSANRLLADGAASRPALGIIDIASLAAEFGISNARDERMYYLSGCAFSQEFLFLAMDRAVSYISALRGGVKKCLVTDLDNTLWGGAVGDVGTANIRLGESGIGKAYADLQAWIRELSRRGIAVCVCSKNDERAAKEPFSAHPAMKLGLDDIAVFKANWHDKAKNIREIADALNIGTDSMVFIDDNPAERGSVRAQLPEVAVPELPADAAQVLPFLQSQNFFETVSLSGEDARRTEMYRDAGRRESAKDSAASLEDYLRGLDMRCAIEPFGEYSIPRVAQLTQRTNQFNLRTVRYSESDIKAFAEDASCVTMSVSLKDAYGGYGIIGAAILRGNNAPAACIGSGGSGASGRSYGSRALFLDTWLMSCRAVKRGVEEFFFNHMVTTAKALGYERIVAEYIPTAKNAPSKDILPNMGFEPAGEGDSKMSSEGDATQWELLLDSYMPKPTFIKEEAALGCETKG